METPPVNLFVHLLRIKIKIEDHRITTTMPRDEKKQIIVVIPGIRLLIKIPDLKWFVTTVAAMDIMAQSNRIHPYVNSEQCSGGNF